MGIPYWIRSGFAGTGKPEILFDKEGGLMHTGRLYHPEDREHTSGREPGFGPAGRAYSAYPIDWDADGDFDLLVGNDQGGIFLRENQGTAKAFAFSTEAVAIEIDGEPAVVPGGYAMPIPADWDGDGLVDLVSGSKSGAVWWFRNAGTASEPALEEPLRLVGSAADEGLGRGKSAQVEVADWDGDGDLDLLVGDAHIAVVDDELVSHGYVWFYSREMDRPSVDTQQASAPAGGDR